MPLSDKHSVRRTTEEQIEEYAAQFGLSLTPDEVSDYQELVNGSLEIFDAILEHSEPLFTPQKRTYTDRSTGWRPSADEDPLNAWILRFEVKGSEGGPLSGYDVGLKDSIALAGYPMTAGSDVFSGFTPTIDATIVTRLLGAGATIIGKQNMESFASSGSGDTSDFGRVLNPYSDGHLAGGSSSGGAAAVATGDCDISIGSDQAGSIRIPSACCGTVGIKPTTGLVPYTGALSLDMGIDHLGPITARVELAAKTLEVIAGEDVVDDVRLDPRQPRGIKAENYTSALDDPIDNLSIGVLEEGFGWDFGNLAIDEVVEDAVGVFADAGANTRSVSMESHRVLSSAAGVIAAMGSARTLEDSGIGIGSEGWFSTEISDAFDAFVGARADELPPSVKQALLTAAHVRNTSGTTPYAMAQNIALDAERRYNRLLEEYDALVMPTIVVQPMTYEPDIDRIEATSREWTLAANTAAFDLTGHPAISVPCGTSDGLPIGMMLVGSHFDESTILQLAARFEEATDWEAR